MASSKPKDFQLPLRPASVHYDKTVESRSVADDSIGQSKPSNHSTDEEHLDNGGKSSDDNQTAKDKVLDRFDLASTCKSLPLINYSAHPNITMLPGLDFELQYNGGFMTQPNSGVVGRILLPGRAWKEPASREGRINVATRIEQIMRKAVQVYHITNGSDGVKFDTISEVFVLTFKKLQSDGNQWNFKSADRKVSAITNQILNARKRFLSKKAKGKEVDSVFFPFQNAIDDVIRVVEGGLRDKIASEKSDNFSMEPGRKRHRIESSSNPWERATKQSRMSGSDVEAEAEIARKPLEEQLAFWRNRSKNIQEISEGLEINLMRADQECQQLRDAALRTEADWLIRMWQLWELVLPAVNRDRVNRGEKEWEKDRLVPFLRNAGLHQVADAMMGKNQF